MVRFQSVMDGGRGRSARNMPYQDACETDHLAVRFPALVLCGLVAWLLKDLP